ncbi:hypothetical protein KFZ58_00575 [Virgibacillus sp. NKC19-16]|uniref:hypothetical protein n=1 Tax=Virgibacillus salidurans TaxID=2831673 RepID=UPI001F325C2D|nr:hypothetical protein [Virgibacillus sp. NKC19-16]UJL46514.1 hypothetical protein KFZ58_00575 [Virgibacillus sp. NKC19-16]
MKIAIMEVRKHAAWYLKGLKRNGKVRKQTNHADEAREELVDILFTYTNELEVAGRAY